MKMKSLCLAVVAFFLMVGMAMAMDVSLQWDANSESNLMGYKIYYDTDGSGAPYSGVGATEGVSPIDVGNVTTVTIHGFPDDATIHFVATAYNDQGLESDYSNEAIASMKPEPPQGFIITLIQKIIAWLFGGMRVTAVS
jgi:hypothetical protein